MKKIFLSDVNAPSKRKYTKSKVFETLRKMNFLNEELEFFNLYLNSNVIYDCSGFSGITTLITDGDDGYCVKISCKNGTLRKEMLNAKLLYRHGVTSDVICFNSFNDYEILVTKKIIEPLVCNFYKSPYDMANFMGKSLQKFHSIKWNLNAKEHELLDEHLSDILQKALKNKQGLRYYAEYMENFDFDKMKEDISKNCNILKNDVIIHGDFNPKNMFITPDGKFKVIDIADIGYGDRHLDICWTVWTSCLYLGIINQKDECENFKRIFLNAYGMDEIDNERLRIANEVVCMYWQEHNEIKYLISNI